MVVVDSEFDYLFMVGEQLSNAPNKLEEVCERQSTFL